MNSKIQVENFINNFHIEKIIDEMSPYHKSQIKMQNNLSTKKFIYEFPPDIKFILDQSDFKIRFFKAKPIFSNFYKPIQK